MSAARCFAAAAALALLALTAARPHAAPRERHLLYVGEPGIRDYTELGGTGILVFDIDHGHQFVKRIPAFTRVAGKPEAVKGICACSKTGRLYISTPTRLACLDLITEKALWEKEYPGGCDRMSITPDGSKLYVPVLEGDHWNVVDGATGEILHRVQTDSGSHNTVVGPSGKRAYLAGLKSPWLFVADTASQAVVKVGPFGDVIRPLTVNGAETRVYCNVNGLLGFEIGDLQSGKLLARVEVPGFTTGAVKRHGCPSHGVGLTPDEKELWLSDGHNSRIHIFDNTVMPPKWITSLALRDQPGWVTFSIDGRHAYPSTGEVFSTRTHQMETALADEMGHPVHSEKLLEIDFAGDKPIRNGDQFGIGHRH